MDKAVTSRLFTFLLYLWSHSSVSLLPDAIFYAPIGLAIYSFPGLSQDSLIVFTHIPGAKVSKHGQISITSFWKLHTNLQKPANCETSTIATRFIN